MNAFDLDTPALYVDLDVMENNLKVMQRRCREWQVNLRPHIKTHKIAEIARLQLAAGASGITVAKIGEAEVMPGDDVLIAYPVMPDKVPRLRQLAQSRRVTVALDSVAAARAVAGINTLVEVDVGAGRCGVQTPADAVRVAQACTHFQGLMYWPSWMDEAGFQAARVKLEATIAALKQAGFETKIVSGGSTPGAGKTPLIPQTTEIRPGTYVFGDANTMVAGACVEADCALRVLVTVVSTARPGQCLIDGGSKTFSSDATAGHDTFGYFPGRSWTMRKMNEEHGYVTLSADTARIGEKIWVIPSHVCPAVNLHDEVWFGRNGKVEGKWAVTARGKVR
jgi:D-serine deaminase-like pyridoxal phosphate-dependent protein